MKDIKRLTVYADKMKYAIEQSTNVEKKAFFARELRKTTAKIQQLTK